MRKVANRFIFDKKFVMPSILDLNLWKVNGRISGMDKLILVLHLFGN